MQMIERSFSDFLRHPKEVVAELADHDVVLRRRNAPALRLCRVDRDESRAETFNALARLLRNLAVHSPVLLAAALGDVYPWVQYLPREERELFAEELTKALLASGSIEMFEPVALLVGAWKATAEIHADPELARRLAGPHEITHGGRVPPPVL